MSQRKTNLLRRTTAHQHRESRKRSRRTRLLGERLEERCLLAVGLVEATFLANKFPTIDLSIVDDTNNDGRIHISNPTFAGTFRGTGRLGELAKLQCVAVGVRGGVDGATTLGETTLGTCPVPSTGVIDDAFQKLKDETEDGEAFEIPYSISDLDYSPISNDARSLPPGSYTLTLFGKGHANETSATFTIVIDQTAPTIVITRMTPADEQTNADSLTFQITFNEPVQQLDTEDFIVTMGNSARTPIANTSIERITEIDAAVGTYQVTVSGNGLIDRNGVVALDLAVNASILDLAENPIDVNSLSDQPNREATWQTYVLDNQAPAVLSIQPSAHLAPRTNADQVTFQVAFNEPIVNLDATDLTLLGTASPLGTIASVRQLNPSDPTYEVLVTGLANSNGTLNLEIQDAHDLQDVAGNPLQNRVPATSQGTTLDHLPPTVTIEDGPTEWNASTSFPVTIQFREGVKDENVSGFTIDSIDLENASIQNFQTVDSNTYLATIQPDGRGGNIRINVPAGAAIDETGNPNLAATEVLVITTPGIEDVMDVAPDPRNSVVESVEVVLSEPVELSQFTFDDITLTRDDQPVALDSQVTVQQIVGSRYRISGLSAFTALDGDYLLTVNGTGLRDRDNHPGTNSQSDNWLMNGTSAVISSAPRLAAADDSGRSPTDGITQRDDNLTFVMEVVDASNVVVEISDGTFVESVTATASGNSYTAEFGFHSQPNGTIGEGTYTVVATATDGLNPATISSPITLIIDETAPKVDGMTKIAPDPRNESVSSVNLQLSEEVDLAHFTFDDVTLSRDGIEITLNDSVTVTRITATEYQIGGLGGLTTADGAYTLTVDGAGLRDLAGNAGIGSVFDTWVMDTVPPTIDAPLSLDPSDDTGFFSTDAITAQADDLTFHLAVSGATTVDLRIENLSFSTSASATQLSDGSYSAEFDFSGQPNSVIPEGVYQVIAIASDGINITTSMSPLTLTIDHTAPVSPGLDLTAASDTSGNHITLQDDITKSPSLTFNVTNAEMNASFTLLRDTTAITQATPLRDSLPSTNTPNRTFRYQVMQTDLAGNASELSDILDVVVDTMAPRLQNVGLAAPDQAYPNSKLSVAVTIDSQPSLDVEFLDEQFLRKDNAVQLELFEKLADGSTSHPLATRSIVVPSAGADLGGEHLTIDPLTVSIQPGSELLSGQHTLMVRATDAAGNSVDSPDFTLFVSSIGEATGGAPNTPVLTSTFDIRTAFNRAIGVADDQLVQPWQMSFDKTTQTVWFTAESASTVGQFDPATGEIRVFDLTVLGAVEKREIVLTNDLARDSQTVSFDSDVPIPINAQITFGINEDAETRTVTKSAVMDGKQQVTLLSKLTKSHVAGTVVRIRSNGDNPHGVFFDFNTHLTPRVWSAHRKGGGTRANQRAQLQDGRLSYLDVARGELVNYDFANPNFRQRLIDAGVTDEDGNGELFGFHAVFVDKTGDVWFSVPESGLIAQLDFDSDDICGINCRTAKVIFHRIPQSLGEGAPFSPAGEHFHPHAIQVAVDDRTGEKWLWAVDVNGSGRVALFRPGSGPQGSDLWTTWDVDDGTGRDAEDLFSNATGTFVQIDDNETPGRPEDDMLVVTYPVTAGRGSASSTVGLIHRYSLLTPESPNNSPARIETWQIPKIPGSIPDIEYAAVNQPYVDRSGAILFIDRYGSVGRLQPSDFQEDIAGFYTSRVTDPILAEPQVPFLLGDLEPTSEPVQVDSTVFSAILVEPVVHGGPENSQDRSQLAKLDMYEVAATAEGAKNASRGTGAFRGTINASNVLYGSLAQNDQITVTVFAEAPRRRMSVVQSPFPPQAGAIVEARMAFQVLRDGSLILTARGDGELSDRQANLSQLLVQAGRVDGFDAIAMDGEASAVGHADGKVTVMGRSASGDVVQLTFTPEGRDWQHKDLFNPNRWSFAHREMPAGHVLADDVVPGGPLGFTVTTAAGRLLAIPIDSANPVRDLTAESGALTAGRVYSTASPTRFQGEIFVYGTNQTGNLVEYKVNSTGSHFIREIQAPDRDHRVLRNVRTLTIDDTRHIFATDGTSRLVHWELDADGNLALAENVSQLTTESGRNFGYFPFQQSFSGRVYTYVAPVLEADGTIRVYGTNGGDLIEFIRAPGQPWRVGNLTNDTNSTFGDHGPGTRVPANAVFGAPAVYLDNHGGRHIIQINAEGEVVEYYTYGDGLFPHDPVAADRINSQNINFFNQHNQPPGNQPSLAKEDVSRDGVVTARDALLIINEITRSNDASGEFTSSDVIALAYNYDVNEDDRVSALDALLVINYLSRNQSRPASEPESAFALPWLQEDEEKQRAWDAALDQLFDEMPLGKSF